MKIFQKVKAIIPVMLFSIILPTVDVATDLNLIYKLYVGTYSCNSTSEMWTEWEDYVKCLETRYSSDLCLHPRERKNTRKTFWKNDQADVKDKDLRALMESNRENETSSGSKSIESNEQQPPRVKLEKETLRQVSAVNEK